jgi:D-hydroxyproline dehydrogenase subunit beta
MKADVVVIGAGVVGACCAAELAQAGQRVVVIEPHAVGSGATAATMGHVMVEDGSEPQFALTSNTRARWLELAPQ